MAITSGRLLQRKNQTGGIKNIYFQNEAFDGTVAAQVVTSLGTLDEVFRFEVKATTNALTETGTSSEDAGTFLNVISLAVTLPLLSPALQVQITEICQLRPVVYVEDYNGNIVLVGQTGGTMSNCTKVTGAGRGDLTGFTLAIAAEEGALSPFLDATTKTALKTFVSNSNI